MTQLGHQSIPEDALPEGIRKFVNSDSPPPIRMMAAKAMAPMGPLELATALLVLSQDAEPDVRETATDSFEKLPEDIIDAVIVNREAHPVLLDVLARKLVTDDGRASKLVLNKAIADETLAHVARHASERVTETIAQNHVRLLGAPAIIEGLYLNTNARMSTINKLLDLCRRNKVSLSGIPALQSAMESNDFDPTEESIDDTGYNVLLAASMDTEDEELSTEAEEELERYLEGEAEEEAGDEKRQSKWQKIQHMSASEKIRLAVLGGREERKILMRDNRKIVHMAAIQSPKVTPGEVVGYAGNRSLPDAVVGYIARRREWVRYYPVLVALVNNPKTPLSESMGFLKMLRSVDLRNLQRNKNVPSQLARQARNLYRNKGKK